MSSRLSPHRHPREERSSSLPTFIPPQLSLLVKQPPTGENWAHELKYDGFRFHARVDRGKVKLLTRTGLDWTDRYQSTATAISKIKAPISTASYAQSIRTALRHSPNSKRRRIPRAPPISSTSCSIFSTSMVRT